ncbi:hypothetical protein FHS07_001887 [Microbacterium proteolyticum]|uniref:Uncharacterized protein n=1 Tax=Microbacterium proteolyticum TaxID=1572644 RepID=A0A7W5CIB1_9MICO|nr:hypothetical protein [Microbacterium proteolyticum]MBB3158191.1 hypothetical protein [Microbacterium proteolyticum]
MAKIRLTDGTSIPVVKPTLFDTAEVERETGWNRKEYARQMRTTSMQTAVAIFASLRRAGHDVTFKSCAELDNIETIIAQPGDARDEEPEGEETPDPQ